MLQTYTFVGSQPGLTVYLQANLHGAEFAGNAVIDRLIQFFSRLDAAQLRGTVRLVPVCNPLSVNTRGHHLPTGRYNPIDGQDWNRIFWEYVPVGLDDFVQRHQEADIETIQQAYQEALQASFQRYQDRLASPVGTPLTQRYATRLQALSLDADVVIDLHSSTHRGMIYVYYFRDRAHLAPYFGFDFAVLLDSYDGNAFDEAFLKPWLTLEAAFAKQGRSLTFDRDAWTVELGNGMTLDAIAVQRGTAGVLNYLRQRQVLHDQPAVCPVEMPLTRTSQVTKYYAPTGGFVQGSVVPGTWVKAGDRLCQLLCFNKAGIVAQTVEVCATTPGLVYDVASTQGVSEGEYLCAVMQPDAA